MGDKLMRILPALLAIIMTSLLLVSCDDSSAEDAPVTARESREKGYFSLGEVADMPEDYSGLGGFDASHFGVFACESKDDYYGDVSI